MRKRKKVRNGVRKGELSFKKEGGISFTLRDSCVPSRLEAGWVRSLLRQRIRIQKRHWSQKAVAFGVFCVPKSLWTALTAGCFLSGLVHFSFRIAVTDSGLPRFGKLRAKHWKCLIKSRLVFIENKVCSEHHGRQNCGKAKCPHKSTGIGCSGECNEPFFANRLCICFVACRTIPLQKSAAKACFSAERIVIGLLSVSVTFALALFVVRSVRSTKNPLWITISGSKYRGYWIIRFWFSYLRRSDFERWTENEFADGRGKLVSVGLEQGVKLFVLLRLPCDCNWISHTSRSLSAADTVFGFQNPENIRAVTVIVHRVRCNWADCACEIPEPGVLGKEPQSQQKRRRLP